MNAYMFRITEEIKERVKNTEIYRCIILIPSLYLYELVVFVQREMVVLDVDLLFYIIQIRDFKY